MSYDRNYLPSLCRRLCASSLGIGSSEEDRVALDPPTSARRSRGHGINAGWIDRVQRSAGDDSRGQQCRDDASGVLMNIVIAAIAAAAVVSLLFARP